MRAVSSAIWTSGDPVSPLPRWFSAITFALSATVTAICLILFLVSSELRFRKVIKL